MATATLQVPARSAAFDAALEGLTRLDETLLGEADYPPLYESGVRYRAEPREVWRHVGHVLAEGWGDCEDLAAWRAAELRVSGEDPDAAVGTYRSGARRYHAIVVRGDGSIEDPSRKLGMKGKKVMKDRDMPISACAGLADAVLGEDDDGDGDPASDYEADAAIGPDPTPDETDVTTDVKQTPNGFRGVARVPLATGRALLTASSVKPTSEMATGAALKLATRALDSKAAQMLLPPQAKLALNLIKSPQARAIARRIGRLRKIF